MEAKRNGLTSPQPETSPKAQHAAIKAMIVSVGLVTVAACAAPLPPPPPPPPPPPAPKVEAVPYRPLPPGGAAYFMEVPARTPEGKRLTVNRDLTDDERVWHFRSAWNVAALNCLADADAPILEGYRAYIIDNQRTLKRINDRVEQEYRKRERSRRGALLAREKHMTRVYNFFALPSARGDFCQTMRDVATEYMATKPDDPAAFALSNFDRIEVPFDQFFTQYESYQRLSAQWDAQYGTQYGASQPGWVAVQQARANGVDIPSAEDDDLTDTLSNPGQIAVGSVTDPETGAEVPVVPVQEGVVSQPVVEPIPADPPAEGGSG